MAQQPKLSTGDLAWVQEQLKHPAPIYLVSELVRLSGDKVTVRRMRRMLIRRGVIEGHLLGKKALVSYSRLMALWPDLWWSIKRAWQEVD